MSGRDPEGPESTPRRRGRGLSAPRIAQTALELIDEKGVAGASMRAIAGRLGVEAMSLYKHVRTRDELLDAVVNLVVAELDLDGEVYRDAVDGWRDYLTRLAYGVRRFALSHPNAFPLVATRPAEAPWVNPPLRSLPWIESLLTTLVEEGFSEEEVLFTYRSFNSFLLGYLLMESRAKTLSASERGNGLFGSRGGSAGLEALPSEMGPARTDADERLDPQGDIDRQEYPTIHRLARDLAEDHFRGVFDRALNEMLDGIAAHLA